MQLSRRAFLGAAALGVTTLALGRLVVRDGSRAAGGAHYADWRDVYRESWRWDRVARGTHPNVYYVPPLSPAPLREDGSFDESASRIPLSYLEKLFGSEVHGALDMPGCELGRKRRGQGSELMDTLILYRWKDALGHLDRDPATIRWK